MRREIEEPVFYRALEGARMYGLTRTQLYQLMKDGRLPFRQLGRTRLVARSDLQALVGNLPVMRGRGAEASASA